MQSRYRAAALIRTNLAACGIEADYNIARDEVLAALRQDAAAFDLILLDPPYDIMTMTPVLDASARVLAVGGLVVLEHATRREPEPAARLEPVRRVKWGDSTLTFFAAREPT